MPPEPTRPATPVNVPPAVAAAIATASAPAPSAARQAHPNEGGYKETIESILVAFILAFVFRAFVVEAFVIPTGSMAPTLLGANMRYRCEDCGYRFTVNFSGRTVGDDVEIPTEVGNVFGEPKVLGVTCPNCAYQVPARLPDQRHPGADATNDATTPPVFYGDRILVLKYLWLLEDPRRWDVVVFKSPDDQPRFSMNYIKRLVGRPGETIVILDGDVYVGPPAADPVHEPGSFKVQTKPRVVQNALWRVVYDNDYLPRRPDWTQPWRVESGAGWTLAAGDGRPSRIFRFTGQSAGPVSTIAFDTEGDPEKYSFSEWLAYDATMWQFEQSRSGGGARPPANTFDRTEPNYHFRPRNNVSDAKLDLYYQRTAGTGPLRLQLTKHGHRFTAEITPGRVTLHHLAASAATDDDESLGTPLKTADNVPELSGSAPVHVEFMNVDYRVSLWLNGRQVLSTTEDQYAPDVARLLDADADRQTLAKPQVRIAAAGQDCALTHVSLWRDIYYTTRHSDGSPLESATPDNPIELFTRMPQTLNAARVSQPGGYEGSTAKIRFAGLAAGAVLRPGRFIRVEAPGLESHAHQVESVEFDPPGADGRAAASGTIYLRDRKENRVPGPIPDGTPITLLATENEYFVLGDNSLISGDARYWQRPVALPDEDLYTAHGRVPERFMLGKAFFVYWPAGYRPADSGPVGVVPNFGEMRFIH